MTKKLNIACGNSFVEGWVNLDFSPSSSAVRKANLLAPLPFENNSVDVIYCSHFIEHIPRAMVMGFLAECFRILIPGGRIRLVCPDLEELSQTYLNERKSEQHTKADFLMLEMLDQCIRTSSGGELMKYYESLESSPELHTEMIAYVKARTGHVIHAADCNIPNKWLRLLDARLLLMKLQQIYCKTVILLLPKAFRLQNVSLSSVGERHTWIYDFHSLNQALLKAGFEQVKKLTAQTSNITDFPFSPLDIDSDGTPRKGAESMYVEALKP